MAQLTKQISIKDQTPINLSAAKADSHRALEQIQRRRGGDQLMRLLQELLEAGQLLQFADNADDPSIRWKPTNKNEFPSGFFAIDNETQSSIAACRSKGEWSAIRKQRRSEPLSL